MKKEEGKVKGEKEMENTMYVYYFLTLLECDGSKCDCVEPISDTFYNKEEAINDFKDIIKNNQGCWYCGSLKIELTEWTNGVEKRISYFEKI